MKKMIQLDVNGEPREVMVEDHHTLLEVLRKELGLTGTKRGCDHGECGSCTVLVDGKAVLSCCQLAVEMVDRKIETVESLTASGEMHPIQKSFVEHGAIQCGFCTPGMVMTAKELLDSNRKPTEDEVKRQIGGNFCRCTGYNQIVRAVMEAAK